MKTRKIACMLLALLLMVPLQAGAQEPEAGNETVTYLNLDGQRLNYQAAK